jgi:hypothetical protein
MKTWQRWVAGATLALAAPLALAQEALDGRKFVGDIGPKGKGVEDANVVFTFAGGTFRSSVCDQYGFDRGAYATTKDGEAIRFEAKTVSAEWGTNHWTGTVKGDVMEGVLVWQRKPSFFRPNPEPVEKWFKAKLQ